MLPVAILIRYSLLQTLHKNANTLFGVLSSYTLTLSLSLSVPLQLLASQPAQANIAT